MPKMTLLEMTQNILSSMSSDEVNSIGDTVESMQVAEEIRNSFYAIFSNRDITEFEGLINLESPADEDRPNLLILPDNVQSISWVKYRNFRVSGSAQFENIYYLPPEEFIQRIVEMDMGGGSNYISVPLLSTSPIVYSIKNNQVPSYYTVFDQDRTLVFDSFDADSESYLTASNALAWGRMDMAFEMNDDFVPPIDSNLFPYLLADAKSACFINIKEVANSKEEKRARDQLVRSQRRLNITDPQYEGVFSGNDFSRNRRGRSVFRTADGRRR